jgi:hypothetical protein
MSTPLGRSIRIVLAFSISAAALPVVSLPARAGEGGAIAAGVAGGVAGTIAGAALQGALPPRDIPLQPIPLQVRTACGNNSRSKAPIPSISVRCGSATDVWHMFKLAERFPLNGPSPAHPV